MSTWIVVANDRAGRAEMLQLITAEQGWNHAEEDSIPWFKSFHPNTFLAARNNSGEILGCIIGSNYEDKVGYIGEYIVKREYRGLGIGKALWNASMQHMKECQSIVLTSMAERGVSNLYKKLGLTNAPDWQVGKRYVTNPDSKSIKLDLQTENHYKVHIPPFGKEMVENVVIFDKIVTKGINRWTWLSNWLRHPHGRSCIITDGSGTVHGYGTIRKGTKKRLRVGPLYCSNENGIMVLLKQLLQKPFEFADDNGDDDAVVVEFMTVSTNQAIQKILAALSSEPVKEATSNYMVKGPLPQVQLDHVYCIADQELNFI